MIAMHALFAGLLATIPIAPSPAAGPFPPDLTNCVNTGGGDWECDGPTGHWSAYTDVRGNLSWLGPQQQICYVGNTGRFFCL